MHHPASPSSPRPPQVPAHFHGGGPRGPSTSAPRPWNPLSTDGLAQLHGSYASFDGERVGVPPSKPRRPALAEAHAQFREHVLEASFPCVGAKSAFNRKRYRFGLYPSLAGTEAVHAVCHDLYEFSHEFEDAGDEAVTFVAMFEGPAPEDDQAFERQLWSQLQRMHELDARFHGWDERVSADPDSAEFSFSIGERAFFVVGLHPNASRVARRAPRPAIVFNLHEQFEALRARGKYESMKKIIRSRDVALQGSVNPVLENFGESSEARQYSGRAVSAAWRCPFRHLHPTASS
jgi:FPC/CPF motif-containing protein YcgG